MAGYLVRLIAVLLTSFFLVNLALGVVVIAIGPAVSRLAASLPPNLAAGIVLLLRLLPATSSLLVAALICLPSYLRFEPRLVTERVSLPCVLAAVVGAGLCLESISRTIDACIELRRFRRLCRSRLIEQLEPLKEPVQWLVQSQEPILACVGFLRPTLIVSDRLSKLLLPEQMCLALEHERAHVHSRDNLKRLLLVLAPDLLPFTRSMRSLERNWVALAEWAADDLAVDRDVRKALTLAETLVKVAKLGGNVRQDAQLSSLFTLHSVDLGRRVDRLIQRSPNTPEESRPLRAIPAAGMAVLLFSIATAGCNLHVSRIAHTWLERLMH
jgi:hypothetical protein